MSHSLNWKIYYVLFYVGNIASTYVEYELDYILKYTLRSTLKWKLLISYLLALQVRSPGFVRTLHTVVDKGSLKSTCSIIYSDHGHCCRLAMGCRREQA